MIWSWFDITEGRSSTFSVATLLAIRICLLVGGLLTGSIARLVYPADQLPSLPILYRALVIGFLACTWTGVSIRRKAPGPLFTTLQITTDICLITTFIYITGGPSSSFIFLYLLFVLIVGLLFSGATAAASAAGILGMYCLFYWLSATGILSMVDGSTFKAPPLSASILQIIGLASAMLLTAFFTSKVMGKLYQTSSLVEESQRNLLKLGVQFEEDRARLKYAEEKLARHEHLARLLSQENDPGSSPRPLAQFVGESPVLRKVFDLIERVAPSDANILITGESGTGKELVAKSIHFRSLRATKPFVPVNCGAIPDNLIESVLFGHKKGSFTGADADTTGLFRQADGGTLFLDEIGELNLSLQVKLLRAIQEKTIRPIGGDRDIPVDTRIITATNRDLRKEIQKGTFREDLFYRLNVIGIPLPPLRERKEDIPLLVSAFLKRSISEGKTPVMSPTAMEFLTSYDYPGNVRELENIIERAVVLGGEVILPEHISDTLHVKQHNLSGKFDGQFTQIIEDDTLILPIKLDDLLGEVEKKYLLLALSKTNGARKKAAELLGINFRSFRYRLQKFGIQDEE